MEAGISFAALDPPLVKGELAEGEAKTQHHDRRQKKPVSHTHLPPRTRPPISALPAEFRLIVWSRLMMPQYRLPFVVNFKHFQQVNRRFTNHFR